VSTRELARRLAFLLHRQRHLDDLESEMRLHRELRAAKFQREGLTRAEATGAAERRFGNKTSLKEISTDMWGWTWLDDVLKDVRHTSRMLRANLLFSVVAVLTLALGIGANTAIFSVTNALLLRALPVQNQHQLFYLHVLPTEPEVPPTQEMAMSLSVNLSSNDCVPSIKRSRICLPTCLLGSTRSRCALA
jgi:hypothetical protein